MLTSGDGVVSRGSDREETAVGHDRGAADEGGLVGEQEGHDLGDLLGLAESPDRVERFQGGQGHVRSLRDTRGHDETRVHGVDADALLAVLQGRGLGQTGHRMLGGGVVGQVLHGGESGDGGGVDDRAAARGQDLGNLVFQAVEDAVEVDVDDLLPVGDLQVRNVLLRADDAGVVEGQVQCAVGLLGEGDGRLCVLGVGDIRLEGGGRAAGLGDLLGDLLRGFEVDVGQDDRGTAGGQVFRVL